MIEVLAFMAALMLVLGVSSTIQGVIRPLVDCLHPSPRVNDMENPDEPNLDPQVQYWRKSKARREAWRQEEREWREAAGLPSKRAR